MTLRAIGRAAAYLDLSLYTLKRTDYLGYLKPYRTPGDHRRYSHLMLDEHLAKRTELLYKALTGQETRFDSSQDSEKGGVA